MYRQCPECNRDNIKILRAGANPVFYGQSIRVVNPPERSDRTLIETEGIHKASIAQSLAVIGGSLDDLRDALNRNSGGNAEEIQRDRLVNEFGFDEDDPALEDLLDKWREQQDDQGNDGDWYDEIEALNLSEDKEVELGHKCLELTFAKESDPIDLATLIDEAPDSGFRTMYEVEYQDLIGRFNFSEITLLREFPLAYVVSGYTRNERSPDEAGVIFQFFERTERGNYPMYGRKTETEGILFQLDPGKVFEWLKDCNLISEDEQEEPLKYLFSNMCIIDNIFEPPQDPLTRAVLGLVHSVSHKALDSLSVKSGLSADSLSEYIFPYNLSFVIYADTRSEFTLGGLENVYRNKLHTCLKQLDSKSRCIFDPPCNERDGSCAYCMFLFEGSCERFNTALSRHYLFGGEHGGTQWRAFWES